MFPAAVGVLRKTVRALLASHAPDQLAVGFTVGMMIGLVPKNNLIALSLCVLLFSLRCNKGIALLAAVAFSFVGPWTDPFAHKVGFYALHMKQMQGTYASVLNLPIGPWLEFNNTVVLGSMLINAYVAYPVYWVTRQVFSAADRLRQGGTQ